MTSKTDRQNLNGFMKSFTDYFRIKKPGGSFDLKNDPDFVRSLAADYYKSICDVLMPVEFEQFFYHLKFERDSFVEPQEFRKTTEHWRATKAKPAGKPTEQSRPLPDDFYEFLKDAQLVASVLRPQYEKYEIIETYAANVMAVHEHRRFYAYMTAAECFAKFYSEIRGRGITEQELGLFQKELSKLNDQKTLARGIKKKSELPTAGFDFEKKPIEI